MAEQNNKKQSAHSVEEMDQVIGMATGKDTSATDAQKETLKGNLGITDLEQKVSEKQNTIEEIEISTIKSDAEEIIFGNSDSDYQMKITEDGVEIKTLNITGVKTINCFGDSLLAGDGGDSCITDEQKSIYGDSLNIPLVMQHILGEGYVVNNYAKSGRTSGCIGVVQGGITLSVKSSLTITSADTILEEDPFECDYTPNDDTAIYATDYRDFYIGGRLTHYTRKGKIFHVYGTAPTEGNPFYIGKGELAVVSGLETNAKDILIIEMGGNQDKTQNSDDIVNIIRRCVDLQKNGKYIILGYPIWGYFHSAYPDLRARLKKEFGTHYVDPLSYLCTKRCFDNNGLSMFTEDDMNDEQKEAFATLSLTGGMLDDQACIDRGILPITFWRYALRTGETPSESLGVPLDDGTYLISKGNNCESVHMNALGQAIVAQMIVDRIGMLNY